MAYKILLNNKEFHFTENYLPCLIHYKENTGGSQFTITLIADLFLQGSKILFLTAYPMAKDNFYEQTKGMGSRMGYVENKKDLIGAEKYQAIILKSSDGDLYLEALKTLKDIGERIVLVKNFEVFSNNIIDSSITLPKIILSGNIDKSVAKKQISKKPFRTIISFSQPEIPVSFKTPALEKYVGYLKTNDKEGLVRIVI